MMYLKYFMEEERENEGMDEKEEGRLISVNSLLL